MSEQNKDTVYGEAYQKAKAYYDSRTPTPLPPKKSFMERITEKYTLALSIIGMLLIASYIGLFLIIDTYEASAEVINIAGRQRMLSQRIAKFAHDLLREKDKEKCHKLLIEAAYLMERSHEILTDGESELNRHGALSTTVRPIYFEAPYNLDVQVRRFVKAAKQLANAPSSKLVRDNPNMEIIEQGADWELLQLLERVVRQYQIDSESAVKRLQLFASLTLSLLLVALFLVERFIFVPLSQQVQKEADKVSLSEKRLRDITSSLSESVIVSDKGGNLVFMNPAAERLLGWKESELHGKSIQNAIYQNSLLANYLKLSETIEKGVAFRVHEDNFNRKDGTCLAVSFATTPIKHGEEVSGAVMAFHDIFTRLKTEKERRTYLEKMENALFRAEEVLNLLSKPPSLFPFFVMSQPYRTTKSIGGGDTIRWMSFRSRYAGIYLHDVSGHDIQEILLNILATAIADNHKINPGKKGISSPSEFFSEMNKELLKFCDNTSHYITAVYSLLDFEKREISLSLAGHPRPWLINPDGTASQVGEPGFLMGQFNLDPAVIEGYTDTLISLKTGQMLLIYTDGLMEEKDAEGTSFEEKFIRDIVPRIKGLGVNESYKLLKSEFEAHLDGRSPDDDVSFILIGTRPADKYETNEFVPGPRLMAGMKERLINYYPPDYIEKQASFLKSIEARANQDGTIINDVSEAYASIIKKLSAEGWPEKRINEVSIAMREIVTNSFLHGNLCSNRYLVSISHVIHDNVLEVGVSDKGIGFDGSTISQAIKGLDLLKESGRGLHMAGMYADRILFNDSGNRCWMLFNKIKKSQ